MLPIALPTGYYIKHIYQAPGSFFFGFAAAFLIISSVLYGWYCRRFCLRYTIVLSDVKQSNKQTW